MVGHPGEPARSHRIRRLNLPQPIAVRTEAGNAPCAVLTGQTWQPVQLARDPWRIDQYWWHEAAISRLYYPLVTEDGVLLTVFHDLLDDAWFQQSY
jgi:hypothetical protein